MRPTRSGYAYDDNRHQQCNSISHAYDDVEHQQWSSSSDDETDAANTDELSGEWTGASGCDGAACARQAADGCLRRYIVVEEYAEKLQCLNGADDDTGKRFRQFSGGPGRRSGFDGWAVRPFHLRQGAPDDLHDGQGLQTLYCYPQRTGVPDNLMNLLWSPNQQLAVFEEPSVYGGPAGPVARLLNLGNGNVQTIAQSGEHVAIQLEAWLGNTQVYTTIFASAMTLFYNNVYALNVMRPLVE